MPRSTIRIRQTDLTIKDNVVAASQADIADLVAGAPDTLDGVALAAGDRVLVKAQTDPIENGIYVVATLGTGSDGVWARALDMQVGTDNQGGIALLVIGTGATTDVLRWYALTSPGVNANLDVGVTSQTWAKSTDTGLVSGDFVFNEVPAGAIDDANTTFVLANTPVAGTQQVFLNGVLQFPGAGNDYTISGDTITMLDAPKGAPGNPDLVTAHYIFS